LEGFTLKLYTLTQRYDTIQRAIESKIKIASATSNKFKEFNAVWDTGATNTVISQKVISEIGLSGIDKITIHTANSKRTADVYLVDLILPKDQIKFPSLRVIDGKLDNIDVLIGMDIICSGDFAISNKNDKTIFSYQIPPTHTTDFEMENKRLRGSKNSSRKKRISK